MMNFTEIFLVTSETIAKDSIKGLFEIILTAIIDPFVIELGYDEEWNLLQKTMAILGIFFTAKVLIFVLPFIIQSLKSIL